MEQTQETKVVPGKVGNLVSFFENMGDEPSADQQQGNEKKIVQTSSSQSSGAKDISKFFSGDASIYQTYNINNNQKNLDQTVENGSEKHTLNGDYQHELGFDRITNSESRDSSATVIVNEDRNGHTTENLQKQDSFIEKSNYEYQSVSQSQTNEESAEITNYQQAIQRIEDNKDEVNEYQQSYSHQEQVEHRESERYERVEHSEEITKVEEHEQKEYSEHVEHQDLVVERKDVEVIESREQYEQSVDTSQSNSYYEQSNNLLQDMNDTNSSSGVCGESVRYVTDHVKGVASPSIIPYPYFNLEEDTKAVHDALKAKGTDEKSLIAILTKRSESQRLQMLDKYQQMYDKDLLTQLKKQLSGDFEELILGLFLSRFELLTRDLHKSMKGSGTDERTLTEIVCTLSDDDITYLKMCYQNAYNKSLPDAVYSETSGSYKKVLLSVLSAAREDPLSCSEDNVALTLCETDAKGKPTIDEIAIRTVLVSYTRPFLYGVFKAYEKRSGKDFSHIIQKVVKESDAKQALLAIYYSILCLPHFYADELHEAMKGLGTKDTTLRRIILLRAEVDLKDIQNKYEALTGKNFIKTIKSETSGDYRNALISIIEGTVTGEGYVQQSSDELNQSQNSQADRIIFDSQESQL